LHVYIFFNYNLWSWLDVMNCDFKSWKEQQIPILHQMLHIWRLRVFVNNIKSTHPMDSRWYGFQLSNFYGYQVLKFQFIWVWKFSKFQVLTYLVINLWLSTFKLFLLLFVFLDLDFQLFSLFNFSNIWFSSLYLLDY
jgi:hypothetical protein